MKFARIEFKFPLFAKATNYFLRQELDSFNSLLQHFFLLCRFSLHPSSSLSPSLSPLRALSIVTSHLSTHFQPSSSLFLAFVFELHRFFPHFNIFNCESTTNSETWSGARFSTEKKRGEYRRIQCQKRKRCTTSQFHSYALVRFKLFEKSVISTVILDLVPYRERHLGVTNAGQRAQNDERELVDSSGGLYTWEFIRNWWLRCFVSTNGLINILVPTKSYYPLILLIKF